MRIAIMGAGGIGGCVGGRLAVAGHEVHLIARGAHLQALQANGLKIETPDGLVHIPEIAATDDPSEIGPVDIVFFTTKLRDTDAAAAKLGPLLGPDTRVITVQNGIDSRDMIAAHVGADRVSAGTIFMAAYIKEPGVITFTGGAQILTFDAMAGHRGIAAFAEACRATGHMTVETTDTPDTVVWQKFVGLTALAAWTGASRLPIGVLRANPDSYALVQQLIAEGIAVATACGIELPENTTERIIGIIQNQPPHMKSSLLVDIEAGKPNEAPWLSGRLHALGQKHGVPTPGHSALWAVLAPWSDGLPAN